MKGAVVISPVCSIKLLALELILKKGVSVAGYGYLNLLFKFYLNFSKIILYFTSLISILVTIFSKKVTKTKSSFLAILAKNIYLYNDFFLDFNIS